MSKRNQSGTRNVAAAATAALTGMFGASRDALAAPVTLTAATYTQNYDHSTWDKGGGTAMGTGWALFETGTGANTSYAEGNGSSATADTWVFHTGSNNELAFGTLRGATTLVSTIGANFQNTIGAGNNIVAIQIAYTGEQWRRGGTGTDQLDFQISTDATSLTTGTWTDQNALDFASLQNSGAAASLDGNNAANRTAITSTITGLNIANTGQFWIRWNDADNTVEHGLGLDDFSLTALTTGYNSQITSSGSVAFGRVMQNSTPSNNSSASLSKTGSQSTTYSATGSVGITVGAPGSFGTGDPESHNLTIGLANVAAGSGTTGAKSFTVTIDNLAATSGAAGQGSADANDTINVSATVLANRQVTASNVALGRRMVSVGVGGTSNLSTTLDNNNATAVTVATTGGPNADGISVTGGTGTLFNAAASTGTRSLAGSFATTGSKSSSVTLITTGEGLTGEAPINVNVPYTATSVGNRVVTATSVSLGRRMVGATLNGASSLSTTGADTDATRVTVANTAGANGDGVTIMGGPGMLYDAATDTGSRNLGGSFGSTGPKSGNIFLITTGEGLSGESPLNVSVDYTGTSVDNRVVSATSASLGTALVSTAMSSGSSLSTSGDDDNRTRITVATTGGPDGNGVSVSGGSGTFFDDAADTGSRTVDGNFAIAGAYSGSVTLLTTGEGLGGESAINVLVPYTATALDHANGSFDTPTDQDTLTISFGLVALNSPQSSGFNLYNLLATVGFTAALDLDAINESGDTFNKFSHNVSPTQIAAAGGNSYSMFFDTTTPGAFNASYTIDLSDEDLSGATSQQMTINVSGEVVPEPATLALLAGGIGLSALRRRRRNA